MLKDSKVEQLFIIKDGFETAVRKGESKGLIELVSAPSSYSSGLTQEIIAGEALRLLTANMAANSITMQYKELGIETGNDFREGVVAFAEGLWEPEPLMTIDYRELKSGVVSASSQAKLPTSSASSSGLIIAFMMFYMLFGSGWIIEERLNGTIKRLGARNGAMAASFWGNLLALFIAGSLQICVFVVVQKVFFGIALFAGLLSYLVLFAYLLMVIALSLFFSSILKTQAQLQAGTPVFALLTGFAGGCFWNFVEMPEGVRRLSLLTPQGWALKGINGLLLNPSDTSVALAPLLILLAAALILLPLSNIILNMQLRNG